MKNNVVVQRITGRITWHEILVIPHNFWLSVAMAVLPATISETNIYAWFHHISIWITLVRQFYWTKFTSRPPSHAKHFRNLCTNDQQMETKVETNHGTMWYAVYNFTSLPTRTQFQITPTSISVRRDAGDEAVGRVSPFWCRNVLSHAQVPSSMSLHCCN